MRPGAWPLVGRDVELVLARAALAGNTAGLVVDGAAGVGKSRFAEEILGELAADGRRVVRLLATRAAATIPFGAAATLLTDDSDPGRPGDDGSDPGEATMATLIKAQGLAAQRATGEPLFVGVDDAHLLDESTAELVYELAVTGGARVLLTLRRSDTGPPPIEMLRDNAMCEELELRALDRTAVAELLTRALDAQVEEHTVEELWRITAGNVLFLRELCRDALDRGTLVRRHGVWTWAGAEVLGARLQELVDSRLGHLDDALHDAAALLALGEPLPRPVLASLVPDTVVEDLVRRGLATLEDTGPLHEPTVRLAHPLYAESLRSRLGPLETTDLYARLADGLATQGHETPDDRLRVVVWSITSGRPVGTPLVTDAARDALARGDAVLAERLARSAAVDPRATLVLGEALAALRRGPEAEAVLAALPVASSDDGAKVAICVARLAAHRSPDLPLAAARQLAAEVRAGVEADSDRDLVAAALADTLCDRGRIGEAGELAVGLLESADPAARAMALGPASTWLVQAGRSEDAVRAGRRALHDALAHHTQLPWAPGLVVGHLGTALLTTGRLDELGQLCEAAKLPPLAPTGRGRGIVALLVGAAALVRGRPATARGALREAALSFERADAVGRHARALALLAEAEALLGDLDSARTTLDVLPQGAALRHDFDLQRARLCVAAARGDVDQAAQRSHELADEARGAHSPFFELGMSYTALRFGHGAAAERVVAVADDVQGAIAAAFGEHAASLAQENGKGLERAAARLEGLGCTLLAAEALVHAAFAYQRRGLAKKAEQAAGQADELRARCEGARTPLLSQGAVMADLTRREREVAMLAAGGMTSRQIGERLGISTRTVDNQLGRVYTKLGLRGRGELGRLLDRIDR